MRLAKSVVSILAAASSALAITINTPSPSSYWVQNTSNTISWSFASSDPNPIDITVTNSNSSFLNGIFSIARFVDLSKGSFTVTNVALVVASGYVINFVNSSNGAQVFASSQEFDVKASGTTPASVSLAAASSTSPSASAGSSSSSTAISSGASSSSNAAVRTSLGDFPILPVFVTTGMALAGGLLAL